MKKLFCAMGFLSIFIIPTMANADVNTQKLNMLKKIYSAKEINSHNPYFYRMLSPSFKNAFDKDKLLGQGGIACIDYNLIVQGNDYDAKKIARTAKFQVIKNGNVKVTFKNLGGKHTLYYVFSCKQNTCLIDDVIEPSGSFKRDLNKCLSELQLQFINDER